MQVRSHFHRIFNGYYGLYSYRFTYRPAFNTFMKSGLVIILWKVQNFIRFFLDMTFMAIFEICKSHFWLKLLIFPFASKGGEHNKFIIFVSPQIYYLQNKMLDILCDSFVFPSTDGICEAAYVERKRKASFTEFCFQRISSLPNYKAGCDVLLAHLFL